MGKFSDSRFVICPGCLKKSSEWVTPETHADEMLEMLERLAHFMIWLDKDQFWPDLYDLLDRINPDWKIEEKEV